MGLDMFKRFFGRDAPKTIVKNTFIQYVDEKDSFAPASDVRKALSWSPDSKADESSFDSTPIQREGDYQNLGFDKLEGVPEAALPVQTQLPTLLTKPTGRGQKCRRPRTQVATNQFDEDFGRLALWTTRMVRNIPNDYTRQDLVNLLTTQALDYNFVYLPMDWVTKANLGYAFVNFGSPEEALRAGGVLSGFSAWERSSEKICEVKWGNPDKQGLCKLIEEYRNSPVMHPEVSEDFQPLVFQGGKVVPLPEPTKKFRLPRGLRRETRPGRQSKGTEAQ